MTTKPTPGLNPVRLEIPDHWTPETAFAVFELTNDLRDQIWSRYAIDIQDAPGQRVRVNKIRFLRVQYLPQVEVQCLKDSSGEHLYR